MSVFYTIASKLNKNPKLKRFLKNAYQITGEILSDKKTSPNSITCVSNPEYEHLFGYYDKSPWDASGNNIIYLRVKNVSQIAASNVPVEVILKNLVTECSTRMYASVAWSRF